MGFDFDKMYCGIIRRGDVILHESAGKELPAVILQDSVLNESISTVVCAPIIPHKKNQQVFVNEILLGADETGLGKDGVCMPHKMLAVDRRNIVSTKAELPNEKLQIIYDAVDTTFGRFRDRPVL